MYHTLLTIYITGLIIINLMYWVMSVPFASDLYKAGELFIRSIVWPIWIPVIIIIIIYERIKYG